MLEKEREEENTGTNRSRIRQELGASLGLQARVSSTTFTRTKNPRRLAPAGCGWEDQTE